jgi:RNA polymerase sigma-70 factor, ECF subfamily
MRRREETGPVGSQQINASQVWRLAPFSAGMDDADAFMELYAREREAVVVFIARRTLDVCVAADLTAETFALALQSWSRLAGRSDPERRAWLFTVARRQVSGYLRRARVERRAVRRLGIRVPPIHEEDIALIEERAGLGELREAVGAELARLSGDQREALRLRVVEERPYDEVAALLGISEQAARARVSRGLRALARALEPHRAAREASR